MIVEGVGVSGLLKEMSADSESLPADEAEALASRVDAAGLFDLPPTVGAAARRPEEIVYEVTVEDADRRHTVRFGGDSVPDGVRSLISWVEGAPGSQKRILPAGG